VTTAGRSTAHPERHPHDPPPTSPSATLTLPAAAILLCLLGLSAAAWALAAGQAGPGPAMGLLGSLRMAGPHGMGSGVDMAMGASLFVGMWVTMTVAMMFPSVAPMVMAHARLSAGRRQGPLAVPLFVGGYLLSWTLVGVAAYGAHRTTLALAPSLSERAGGLVAGGALAGAGLYQLSRLKSVCLSHCRSPLEFFLHWRPGLVGAARMGVGHGFFCVGCCWGLMLVLFVVGLMNLVWMGVVAAVIFGEKVAPFGRGMATGVGVALVVAGAVVALFPAVLGWRVLGG
jgi:predicted metal-binding membrane protein